MAFNPMVLFKLRGMMNQFSARHPKAVSFVKNEILTGLPADTVLEITITKPAHEPVTTNMLVTQEDLDMLQELQGLRQEAQMPDQP
ncbi:MAG: hypothetical protein ACSW8K_13500 [bacterium]